ncbi:MAG: hypothetical protein V3T45_07835 [Nitrospinaceae bacterium]
MEIEFFSYKLAGKERFYSQSFLFFLLALGLSLGGNFIVYANPSSNMSIEEDAKIPLSKRAFDSSGQWRAPQKPKNTWRESEEHKLTLRIDRIQRKSSSLYDSPQIRDNWDPYSPGSGNNMLTKPAKVFEFRF